MKQKQVKRCRKGKAGVVFILVLVLTLSPCGAFFSGNVTAWAENFTIRKLKDSSIIKNGNFAFYGSPLRSDLLYWIKSDGTPLFCVEREKHLLANLDGSEVSEEYGESTYLDEQEYELVSLVLQCCGMIRGEAVELHPGVYIAGQAAVWGITSTSWKGVNHFRKEMEKVYAHIEDWYEFPGEEILAQCQEATEKICETIEAYYGDESPFVPSFASKYKEKAPVWAAYRNSEGNCRISFGLDGKSEAVKDFIFEMPEGWNYEWQGDQVVFYAEKAEEGTISITGRAKEGTLLDKAMPIGLVHIVGPKYYSFFQHLASAVECKTNWSCYFKLQVTEPELSGKWEMPEVLHYSHQETFHTLYGVGLEKIDGDTTEPISGVSFQPLEYFDEKQLEKTDLDRSQIKTWKGWKANCGPEITDEDGCLEHWDKKEYLYEKTYCSGHPEPEINYQGSDEAYREILEQEAHKVWEECVEECSRKCDFHSMDGSGRKQMEEERDLLYQQFIHLVYGYTFQEISPAPGYLPHGEHEGEAEIEKVFLVSQQAGGEVQEKQEEKIQRSIFQVNKVNAFLGGTASSSDAEEEEMGGKEESNKAAENREEDDKTEDNGEEDTAVDNKAGNNREEDNQAEESGIEENKTDEDVEKGDAKEREKELVKKIMRLKKKKIIWLTSEVEKIETQEADDYSLYQFTVKNYKIPPEETTPEETPPEETTPEETTPEETPPEETTPEETTPEETLPEETPPEETTPEETTPEETLPEETTPEETLPKETPPEETTPKETLPEETPPPSPPKRPGGGRGKVITPPPSIPEETTEAFTVEEEPVPQALLRMGWIEAEYATPSIVQKKRANKGDRMDTLPETGERGGCVFAVLFFLSGIGVLLTLVLRKRRKALAVFFFLSFSFFWTDNIQAAVKAGAEEVQAVAEAGAEEVQAAAEAGAEEVQAAAEAGAEEQKDAPISMEVCAEGREAWLDRKMQVDDQEIGSNGDKLLFYYSTEEVSGDGSPEKLTAENGQVYWLESCRPVWLTLSEKEEWISETAIYQKVERNGQIPESLSYKDEDEESGRYGEGELLKTSMTVLDSYWDNQFQIPLRFCDYDAETYHLQELEVPKEDALEFLLEHQQGLLEAVGCAPDSYHIDSIIWNGESYNVGGVAYRDALAYGRRLVCDYFVEYGGTVIYPETEQEQWEAVYTAAVSEILPQAPEEDESRMEEVKEEKVTEGAVPLAVPPEEKTFSWKLFRRIVAYSVSLLVFLPVLGYLFLLFRRRKKRFVR